MSNKTLTQYLRELRQSHNYSQQEVSSYLNITRQTYSHYETGRITPPPDSLYRLALLYHISADTLLELAVTDKDGTLREIKKAETSSAQQTEDLSAFLTYISQPEQQQKFKYLSTPEKELLYLYHQLDKRDQEDILDFLRLKHRRRR